MKWKTIRLVPDTLLWLFASLSHSKKTTLMWLFVSLPHSKKTESFYVPSAQMKAMALLINMNKPFSEKVAMSSSQWASFWGMLLARTRICFKLINKNTLIPRMVSDDSSAHDQLPSEKQGFIVSSPDNCHRQGLNIYHVERLGPCRKMMIRLGQMLIISNWIKGQKVSL